MKIGNHVIYVDEHGKEHNALVTAVWSTGSATPEPSLNVTYVSDDEDKRDQYGRQLERGATSVVHQSKQGAHGRYWKEA